MKQIVLTVPADVVSIYNHDVNTDKYYGIELIQFDGHVKSNVVTNKGFLQRVAYRSEDYQIVCVKGLTRCNGYADFRGYEDLRDVIKHMLTDERNGQYKVYELDDAKSLFDWFLK